jgi:hypothetical protein
MMYLTAAMAFKEHQQCLSVPDAISEKSFFGLTWSMVQHSHNTKAGFMSPCLRVSAGIVRTF